MIRFGNVNVYLSDRAAMVFGIVFALVVGAVITEILLYFTGPKFSKNDARWFGLGFACILYFGALFSWFAYGAWGLRRAFNVAFDTFIAPFFR